jgi:(p)ppGpp synthase/HD superfamily hydrolase
MKIAFNAHKDQMDKSGLPYIFHPYHLAEQMTDEISVCVALLHDVVEDTSITLDYLVKQRFPEAVIETLRLLTHKNSVPYINYVQKIKDSGNRVAIAVKIADLQHNSDLSRLDHVDEKAMQRVEEYKKAINLLTRV